MKVETLQTLLAKQEQKLAEMEQELNFLFDNDLRKGHGGTPHILDNSKGRQMKRWADKYDERIRSKFKKIDEQKEKIEKTKYRISTAENKKVPTKRSMKFLKKNEIHPALLRLAEEGKLNQWERNPHLFFVADLKKVALITVGGKVGINTKYPARSVDELKLCQELLRGVNALDDAAGVLSKKIK